METTTEEEEEKRLMKEPEESERESERGGPEGEKEKTEKMPTSKRVEELSHFLRKQQEVVYKEENISKFFSPPVQKVAIKCWEQIHPNISTAIEGKYRSVLEDMGINEKLAELDRQQCQSSGFMPAWRPTGIPQEDSKTAEKSESRQYLRDFQSRLMEAEEMSRDLEQQMREKEEELVKLDTEISTAVASIQHISSSFPLPSSSSSSTSPSH